MPQWVELSNRKGACHVSRSQRSPGQTGALSERSSRWRPTVYPDYSLSLKIFFFIFHQYTSWKMLYLVFVIKNCRFHVFSKSSLIKLFFLSSMKAYYISVRNVWYWYWPKTKKHFVYNVYTYVFWRGLWTMLQEAMREKYSSVKQESNGRAILWS